MENGEQNSYIVRSAKRSDVTAIKLLEMELNLSPWSEPDYRAEIERADSVFLVVENCHSVVGFALSRLITTEQKSTNLHKTDTNENRALEIFNIGISPNHQRRKLAHRLLHALLREAAPETPVHIILDVRSRNANAIAFYDSEHFVQIGQRRNFYANPTDDSIVMLRNLTNEQITNT